MTGAGAAAAIRRVWRIWQKKIKRVARRRVRGGEGRAEGPHRGRTCERKADVEGRTRAASGDKVDQVFLLISYFLGVEIQQSRTLLIKF